MNDAQITQNCPRRTICPPPLFAPTSTSDSSPKDSSGTSACVQGVSALSAPQTCFDLNSGIDDFDWWRAGLKQALEDAREVEVTFRCLP